LNPEKEHYWGMTLSFRKNGILKIQNFELNHAIATQVIIGLFTKE